MFIPLLLILLPLLSYSSNSDFFDTANKQIKEGYEWHYVGPQSLDPNAKSIPLQCEDSETNEPCSEPYIIYKLKK